MYSTCLVRTSVKKGNRFIKSMHSNPFCIIWLQEGTSKLSGGSWLERLGLENVTVPLSSCYQQFPFVAFGGRSRREACIPTSPPPQLSLQPSSYLQLEHLGRPACLEHAVQRNSQTSLAFLISRDVELGVEDEHERELVSGEWAAALTGAEDCKMVVKNENSCMCGIFNPTKIVRVRRFVANLWQPICGIFCVEFSIPPKLCACLLQICDNQSAICIKVGNTHPSAFSNFKILDLSQAISRACNGDNWWPFFCL